MHRDFIVALVLIGVFVAMVATRQQFPQALELLLALTRPGATIFLLGSIVGLLYYDYKISALIASVLSIYLLKTLWTTWPRSDDRRLHLEVGRDLARFDPSNSIDLQFANGSVTHNAPHLLVKPWFPELLVFPPSSERQHEMNGSPDNR
jgi:hypothetical protein